MQKALIITSHLGLRELNKELADGAKVIMTCPMPSSAKETFGDQHPTCLVIIEKAD